MIMPHTAFPKSFINPKTTVNVIFGMYNIWQKIIFQQVSIDLIWSISKLSILILIGMAYSDVFI